MKTIVAKIDVSKIDKNRLFKGAKGTYLDIVLIENKDGVDQYGNSHMVCQSVSKEERERGVKGPILGNAKIMGQTTSQKPVQSNSRPNGQQSDQKPEQDDVPF